MTHPDAQLDDLVSSTIMLVDDEPTVIGVLESFLEGEGYTNLVTATDSGEALSLLDSSPVDLLLLDLNMPGVDGFANVSAIIAMARSLGLRLVAEGVETRAQLDFLRRRGCDEFQGFLYSEPVPPADCAALIADPHPGQPFR